MNDGTNHSEAAAAPRALRLAVLQFTRERLDPESNLRRMPEMLRRVEGVDLAIMPEAWVVATHIDADRERRILDQFGEIAAAGRFTVITGGLFVQRGDRVRSVCHVIGPDGSLAGAAEKIFPSFPVGERKYCDPGDRLPLFDVAGAKVGILVCVDLFYPELARSLAARGAEVLLNPANIPAQRVGLWRAMAATRAAENTVYTVFACNTNTDYADERPVSGGSAVFAPWGDVMADAGADDTILRAEIDLSQVEETRKRWRYLEDISGAVIDADGSVARNGE